MEAHRPGFPPRRATTPCEPLQGGGLLLRLRWPPPSLGSQLPRGGVGRRRSDRVWRPAVEGGRRTTRERRTKYVRMAASPALEGHPRASGARCAAGGSQTACWPGIGTDVGAKEARRTPPQATEDLMECRLGRGGDITRLRPNDCPSAGEYWISTPTIPSGMQLHPAGRYLPW